MIYKKVYYSLEEVYKVYASVSVTLPYAIKNLKEISDALFTTPPTYPITLNDTNITKLWNEIYARFYKEAIITFKIPLYADENSIESSDIEEKYQEWFLRLVSIISRTYPYYNTLLATYSDAQSHLMDDIKAISKNTIKFNETPQNYDTSGVYEGDNHLTNFTKTEGENASPLSSKIMRLKEIQDHYKKVLNDWVDEFHCLFIEEGD